MALPRTKSEAMRLALLGGVGISVASAIRYAPFGWVRPGYPHIHIVTAIVLNMVGMAIMGRFYRSIIGKVPNRLRAMEFGALICGPLAALVLLTINLLPVAWKDVGEMLLFGGGIGAAYGAGMWYPRQTDVQAKNKES
jgi:hypothetical protein